MGNRFTCTQRTPLILHKIFYWNKSHDIPKTGEGMGKKQCGNIENITFTIGGCLRAGKWLHYTNP